MDMNALLAVLHQLVPAQAWDAALKGLGWLMLITQVAPRLLAWGVPAATRGADWLANLALNSPLRPLFLWQAPAIVKFLDDTTSALEQVMNTFKSRLEVDLAAAAQAKPADPVKPA